MLALLVALLFENLFPQPSSNIRLNQIGFYPSMPKIAVVKDAASVPFYVISTSSNDTVYIGTLSLANTWSYSQESVSIADFSSLRTSGTFTLSVQGVGASYPFVIEERVHLNVAIGSLKSYYYQRASTALPALFAGTWARSAGHPDTNVLVHASAATTERPVNTKISSSRGWYDAGDYNKYIVNSGISTYTLLAAYEHFPEYCAQLKTNIPESSNNIPDILDEALWNVRWMLTMQDPNDGGVYHKLTNPNFDGYVMPAAATSPRYVVQKSTAATLDFAAVMAQMARIAKDFTSDLPGFSDSCLQSSLLAWKWARKNPAVYYNQSQMNSQFDPDINTGAYGDENVSDEFAWAAAELFITTGQDSFLTAAHPLSSAAASVPGWPNVRTLGLYSLAHYAKNISDKVDTNAVRLRLIALANTLRNSMNSSAYRVVMGAQNGDFSWGSNAVAANQGMELLIAFRLTQDSTYLHAALSNLDYLLGRNGTTYCFVTGFGSQSPLAIHHRPSAADGIAAPVPGLLAGGPNPNREDGLTYPSTLPALAYIDHVNSYASNEICINWNAPLVYLAIGLEALLSPNGLPTSLRHQHNSTLDGFDLSQNYPNPFNPETTIRYQIPTASQVQIAIHDLLGRKIRTLVNDTVGAGTHMKRWNGKDDNNQQVASGAYIVRMLAGNEGKFVIAKKILLVK